MIRRHGPFAAAARRCFAATPPPLPDPSDPSPLDRRGTGSRKHERFGDDAVPLWVADMDFRSPRPIVEAVTRVAAHGVYGYTDPSPALTAAAVDRMGGKYGFGEALEPNMLRWLPGLLPGINHVVRARRLLDGEGYGGAPSAAPMGVAVCTPIYAPFLSAPWNCEAELVKVPLAQMGGGGGGGGGGVVHYEMDWEAMEASLSQPSVRVLLWCNPHNPTGRVWSRGELSRLASLCVSHGVTLLSDEVWAEVVYDDDDDDEPSGSASRAGDGAGFTGMGALLAEHPELSLVVLTSPSKAFNVATTDIALAAIPDARLRRAFSRVGADKAEVTPFGYAACEAAYVDADGEVEAWRRRLVAYLAANRDHAEAVLLGAGAPGLRLTRPEASYLTWIDCGGEGVMGKAARARGSAFAHFLDHGVAFTDGTAFGDPAAVRLNFATTRDVLDRGLERAVRALETMRE